MFSKFSFLWNKKKASRKGIKYIFSINSGRAGSEYLSSLLGCAPNVYSFHEPKPQMIGDCLRLVSRNGLKQTFSARRLKSKEILKTVSNFPEGAIYVETNHMFIKTFYDVVVHDLEKISVVYLQRDFLKTLKSFVQLCYFSKKNAIWPDWMISPNAKTAKINCIGDDDSLDYIDLSIAYLIDIEARARTFKLEYPEIPFYELSLESLNCPDFVENLFDMLGVPFSLKTKEVIGKKINHRSSIKKQYNNQVDEKELYLRLCDYLKKGQDAGIIFPEKILQYM